MNTAIELHDSECLAIEVDKFGQGFVLLEAYVHRTEGVPGEDSGEGGVQRIRLKVGAMKIDGEVGNLPADIFEGSLTIGTSIQDNMIRFPAVYAETVCLSLVLSVDARIVTIYGNGIDIAPEGNFRFIEFFSQR